jgi:hypothetical protein
MARASQKPRALQLPSGNQMWQWEIPELAMEVFCWENQPFLWAKIPLLCLFTGWYWPFLMRKKTPYFRAGAMACLLVTHTNWDNIFQQKGA